MKWSVIGGAVAAVLVVVSVPVWYFHGSKGEVADVKMATAGSKERVCKFSECERAGCNHDSAPYACFDDHDSVGCSPLAWPSEICKDSCKLEEKACEAPDDDSLPSCKGVKCHPKACDAQKCGDDAPYRCTEGSAGLGCSDDPWGWALAVDTLCSSCCDSRTCPE